MFGRASEERKVAFQQAIEASTEKANVQETDFLNTQNSIIGPDLSIIAENLIVISQTSLRMDGKTTGEIRATEIIIGESAEIAGAISAETIEIHGNVTGSVSAPSVSLAPTARVDGEIHHSSFEIQRGAIFKGQSFHNPESSNLMPKLDGP